MTENDLTALKLRLERVEAALDRQEAELAVSLTALAELQVKQQFQRESEIRAAHWIMANYPHCDGDTFVWLLERFAAGPTQVN